MSLPRYPKYKDSGVDQLGRLPNHWQVVPLQWLTDPKRPIMYGIVLPGPDVGEGIPVLKGGNVKPDRMNLGAMARTTPEIEAPFARARLRAGDLVYSIRGSIGDCEPVPAELEGSNITQDVARVAVAVAHNGRWARWALLSSPIRQTLASGSLGAAVRGINIFDLKRAQIPTPPPTEQDAIASFLDRETSKIDALVAEQQRLIELLKEKRQAVISHAVTKGLNPDVSMKESGVPWLGKVPAHWTPVRVRHLFSQEKRQDQQGEPVLSVYRDYGVILKDSRDDNINKTPEDLSAYQLVTPGDLVVNKMKAWQGSLGVSTLRGVTSPDYVVFAPRHQECAEFLHVLFRCRHVVSVYRSISNGIRPDQWRLEPDSFLGLPLFLPPLGEQREIASRLGDIISHSDALTLEAERAIALLQERRTALISAAVTGQIDVRFVFEQAARSEARASQRD